MMLQALCAYADRVGLLDLDFEKRKVDYQLVLARDGRFLGIVPIGNAKTRAELEGLPVGPPAKNNPGFPNFVVDNANYVLGTPKAGADAEQKRENAEKCRVSFRDLVARAANATQDEGLLALVAFLQSDEERMRADEALAKADSKPEARGDRVLVPMFEPDGSMLHARPLVRKWWMETKAQERVKAANGPLGRCLVTGTIAPIARIHDDTNVHPFPGTGAKLVAFDKAPFASHGLEQGANASVSETAAKKYMAALTHLIEKDGERRRSALLLDGETLVVFWTRDESEAPKLLLSLFDPVPSASDAIDSIEAIWRGVEPKRFDPTPFYAMTIAPYTSRIMVRDWLETTASALKKNLEKWFGDLKLGEGEAEPMPLLKMLHALQATPSAQKDKRGLPPGLATRVFRAAVGGAKLPASLLSAALARLRVPPREREDARFVLRARVSLIKAVLLRQGKEIGVALDESKEDVPYLLGRLFAALERLQLAAVGKDRDLNATIRDKYFGAASSTPAHVFPRLLRLSMHHASKVESRFYESTKARILDKLPAKPFPAVMDLTAQGLFALGYYHQREAFYRKPIATDEAQKSTEKQEEAST